MWSIDACLYSYHLYFSRFLYVLSFYLFFLLFLSTSHSFCFFPLSSSLFTVHSYPFLYYPPWWDLPFLPPLIAFGSLWVSFQDCLLAYWLLSHYHCFECVGCTTFHSQKKLLVLFLTSLCFSLPSSR